MNLKKISEGCIELAKEFPEFLEELEGSGLACRFGTISGRQLTQEERRRLNDALIRGGYISSVRQCRHSSYALRGTPIENVYIGEFTVDESGNIRDPYGNVALRSRGEVLNPGYYLSALKDEFGTGEFTISDDVLYPTLVKCKFLVVREGSGATNISSAVKTKFTGILPCAVRKGEGWSEEIRLTAFTDVILDACRLFKTDKLSMLHMYMKNGVPVLEELNSKRSVIYGWNVRVNNVMEELIILLENIHPLDSLNISDLYIFTEMGRAICNKMVIRNKENGESVVTIY